MLALEGFFVGGWPDSAIAISDERFAATKKGQKAAAKTAKAETKLAKTNAGGASQDTDVFEAEDGMTPDGLGFENPVAEELVFEQESEPTSDGAVSPRARTVADGAMSPRLTAAEAAALKDFAESYDRDYIRSVHSSLLVVFQKQRDNHHTMAAFQDLIRKKFPPKDHLEALHAIADGVPPEVVNAILWLWCNGVGAPLEIAKQMVDFDKFMGGHEHIVDLTVRSAAGVAKTDKVGKSDPYVVVKSGSNRNQAEEVGQTANPCS